MHALFDIDGLLIHYILLGDFSSSELKRSLQCDAFLWESQSCDDKILVIWVVYVSTAPEKFWKMCSNQGLFGFEVSFFLF